jgi:transposase
MNVARIGVDLAKNVFQIHGVNANGHVVLRRQLRRAQVLAFFANLPSCLVGMEACCGAYHWAREITRYGHTVRIISPQFVKPYVKSNKNDRNDAEAICEAVSRPAMRFVPIKSVIQQDIQAAHRVRARLIVDRTGKANQIRSFLGEYGIVMPQSIHQLRQRVPEILEDAENGLNSFERALLADLYRYLRQLDEWIAEADRRIQGLYASTEACQRISQVEGIGVLTATALVSAIGEGREFKNGREVAAWLGLGPRQHSSGGKPRLLGISKRGDSYLRTILIHGARSAMFGSTKKEDRRSDWLRRLQQRRHRNIAAVALANRNVRVAWALLRYGDEYRRAA